MQQLFGIVIVFALLGGMLLLLRRKGGKLLPLTRGTRPGRSIQVIERTALTANHSLHLVEFNGQRLLLGVSPGGIEVLQGVARLE